MSIRERIIRSEQEISYFKKDVTAVIVMLEVQLVGDIHAGQTVL
jgi:hypothetical protein